MNRHYLHNQRLCYEFLEVVISCLILLTVLVIIGTDDTVLYLCKIVLECLSFLNILETIL